MEEIYLVLIVLLFILAVSDLVVGVSNDAVNFLNSAIGSRVASRTVIMTVASLGIIIGATFSSGIMEVARSGIFNPGQFYFHDVMIIFIAVMITDIILLDLFNTYGMPTSTTVSIVFELLGASFVVAILKIWDNQLPLDQVNVFINSSNALRIVSGIFLSVGIAFTVGIAIQYLSRLLLTFRYHKQSHLLMVVWSSMALTAITYFLFVKGLKGASFVSADILSEVQNNYVMILGISLVAWSIILFLISRFTKFNILRLIVLFGTFALAMAFAGNDLVNFIGVPIAGLEAFKAWTASGRAPTALLMESLNEPVQTDTLLLILAGLIMAVTLWFSKKARTVTETEVNLGRQHAGDERFTANKVSRGIVRGVLGLGNGVKTILPKPFLDKLEKRFEEDREIHKQVTPPAFDLVRASVNLTVASILISAATSLKLPLSTTYVSFMVAMGTSLADRAWGRDSAVYRVSGVLNVILGWFLTALIAFTTAGLFAYLVYNFGLIFVGILFAGAVLLVINSSRLHRRKSKSGREKIQVQLTGKLNELFKKKITENLAVIQKLYSISLRSLVLGNGNGIKTGDQLIKQLLEDNQQVKANLVSYMKTVSDNEGKVFLYLYDQLQNAYQSSKFIYSTSKEHILNLHEPLNDQEVEIIEQLLEVMDPFFEHRAQPGSDHKGLKTQILSDLEDLVVRQAGFVKKQPLEKKSNVLLFNLLLESRDLVVAIEQSNKVFSQDDGRLETIA